MHVSTSGLRPRSEKLPEVNWPEEDWPEEDQVRSFLAFTQLLGGNAHRLSIPHNDDFRISPYRRFTRHRRRAFHRGQRRACIGVACFR